MSSTNEWHQVRILGQGNILRVLTLGSCHFIYMWKRPVTLLVYIHSTLLNSAILSNSVFKFCLKSYTCTQAHTHTLKVNKIIKVGLSILIEVKFCIH